MAVPDQDCCCCCWCARLPRPQSTSLSPCSSPSSPSSSPQVPPVLNQFVTRALDKNQAETLFKLMLKYRCVKEWVCVFRGGALGDEVHQLVARYAAAPVIVGLRQALSPVCFTPCCPSACLPLHLCVCRPESKKEKAERLKAEAAAREAGKVSSSSNSSRQASHTGAAVCCYSSSKGHAARHVTQQRRPSSLLQPPTAHPSLSHECMRQDSLSKSQPWGALNCYLQ